MVQEAFLWFGGLETAASRSRAVVSVDFTQSLFFTCYAELGAGVSVVVSEGRGGRRCRWAALVMYANDQ